MPPSLSLLSPSELELLTRTKEMLHERAQALASSEQIDSKEAAYLGLLAKNLCGLAEIVEQQVLRVPDAGPDPAPTRHAPALLHRDVYHD